MKCNLTLREYRTGYDLSLNFVSDQGMSISQYGRVYHWVLPEFGFQLYYEAY